VVDIAEWKITAWAFDYWLRFFVSGDYLQDFYAVTPYYTPVIVL
jgi:hypothetical protein